MRACRSVTFFDTLPFIFDTDAAHAHVLFATMPLIFNIILPLIMPRHFLHAAIPLHRLRRSIRSITLCRHAITICCCRRRRYVVAATFSMPLALVIAVITTLIVIFAVTTILLLLLTLRR